jgi:WhiB family redox-sensing transcriptional regulator
VPKPRATPGAYTGNTSTADDPRYRGLCRDEDPELFFPVGTGHVARAQAEDAKAVCRSCPLLAKCLSWALTTGEDHGVWGGLTEQERRELRRREGEDAPGDPTISAARRQRRRETESGLARVRELAKQGLRDHEVAERMSRERPGEKWTFHRVTQLRLRNGIEAGHFVAARRGRGAA